jgi:carboxylesterase type B
MTKSGAVCGTQVQSVQAFRGIPFAESTAGAKRWTAPIPKAAWSDVYSATAFGAECPQNSQIQRVLPQSEDCLTLNVWTPNANPNARLPVLVYIHGGAFVIGSSGGDVQPSDNSQAIYDGTYLAKSQNIVVVTMNYRLGALGFLAGALGLSGNYGLQDQQLALEWVRDNIAAFGGDAAKVTLSGESAGASAVGFHLVSAPRSQTLFQAAIMQSDPLGLPVRNLTEAKRTGEYFTLAAGCQYSLRPLECMRAKPVEALLKAQTSPRINLAILEFGLYALITWSPVVDGVIVTQAPLGAAAAGNITKPIIIGTNTNEGELFVGERPISRLLYRAAVGKLFSIEKLDEVIAQYPAVAGDNRTRIAQIATDYFFYCPNLYFASQAKAPAYSYEFKHVSAALRLSPRVGLCDGKTCHGDDLPFAFNSLGNSSAISAADRSVAKIMTDDWGAFIRSQQPVTANWRPFKAESKTALEISATPTAVTADPNGGRCAFWDKFGYGRYGVKP